jgi:hypothetical protein
MPVELAKTTAAVTHYSSAAQAVSSTLYITVYLGNRATMLDIGPTGPVTSVATLSSGV